MPHRRSAEQKRFIAAAKMQNAIGEDMAAFEIGGELDFVDCEEGHVGVARHRFDGADSVARIGWNDLSLRR